MKKGMRTGFLVSLGVIILLIIFPLGALACQYDGNGGCAGFWLGIEQVNIGTYYWRAELWQVGGGTPVETQTGHVHIYSGDLGKWIYVPTGVDPSDGNTWTHWSTPCNGSYYVKLSWAGYWSKTTDPVTCQTPSAVTLASFTAAPAGSAIALGWQTATELDNLGFNLYRAESADGPRTKLNASLIPSQATGSAMGATYQYVDKAVKPGITYAYWLEAVDVSGATTLNGPVSAGLPPLHRQLPARPRLTPIAPVQPNR